MIAVSYVSSPATLPTQGHPSMSRPLDTYRVYAIKYAHHERRSPANFIGGDSHDVPMPLDYFVWAVYGPERCFIVDPGFDQTGADKRGRVIIKPIQQGLTAIGIDPAAVQDVIITHMHYDHAGNRELFPRARDRKSPRLNSSH